MDSRRRFRGVPLHLGGHAMKNPGPYIPDAVAQATVAASKVEREFTEPQPPPFPLHCLPTAVAEMGRAICRSERTPDSLAGCCLLGVLSAAVGSGLQVRSAPDRFTRGNLLIMASGESGSGKSETMRHAARPFLDLENQIIETWHHKKMPKLLAEKELLESEIANIKRRKSSGPVERQDTLAELEEKRKVLMQIEAQLQPPALSVEDITVEALAVNLAAQNECLSSLSADAGEIVNNLLGRYNKLDRTDDGLYVKAWTGDRFKQHRVGRPPVVLKRPCLSGLWLTQPDKVETILSERALTEGGAIPRLLLCHTNCEPRPIVEGVAGIPEATAQAYSALVRGLVEAFRFASETTTVEVSAEAMKALNDHFNQIVARWHSGELHDVTSYAVRWTEQAWRIAVCLHAGRHGTEAGERKLSLETANAAIEIADWFSFRQLEILAAGRQAAREAKRIKVLELLGMRPKGISARDVQRELHLARADEARSILDGMERDGLLKTMQVDTGGRPQHLYRKA